MKVSKTILLVEDDDNHAEIFTFHALGHLPEVEITRMKDGEMVMRFLEEHQEPGPEFPSLIILDLNLPRFNGLEVLEAIKEHPVARRIPTIIFTSSTSEKDISRAWRSGVNSYLRKPVASSEFKPLIGMVLDYWESNVKDRDVYMKL